MNKYLLMILAAPVVPSTNPYIDKLTTLMNEVKGWLIAGIGIITVVIVIKHAIEYQQGGANEKVEAASSIRKALVMGGGASCLAWFAAYVFTKMQ